MYTTQSRVEAYLSRELTDDEALLIDDTIAFISEFVDSYTNRSWSSINDEEEVEATERYFDGNGRKELDVGQFTDPTEIVILDSQGDVQQTLELTTDWLTFPANKDVKTEIRLRSYRFPTGRSNIKITAKWGGGTPPNSIVLATTALVSKNIVKQSATNGEFKSESIEGYSYTLKDASDTDKEIAKVLSMLDMHKRILL